MIDKKTGHIIISDTIHIKRDDLQHDVLSLNIGQTNKQWDHGNGWSWIEENNVFVDNKYFIFQFGFFEKKLKQISFCVSDTKFDFDNGWDTWSEEKGGVSYSKDSFVVNETFVLLINICAEKPALRVAAKR
jgi:hypothetical protein